MFVYLCIFRRMWKKPQFYGTLLQVLLADKLEMVSIRLVLVTVSTLQKCLWNLWGSAKSARFRLFQSTETSGSSISTGHFNTQLPGKSCGKQFQQLW